MLLECTLELTDSSLTVGLQLQYSAMSCAVITPHVKDNKINASHET